MLHLKSFKYKRREEKGAFVFTTCCPVTFAEMSSSSLGLLGLYNERSKANDRRRRAAELIGMKLISLIIILLPSNCDFRPPLIRGKVQMST